MEIKVTSLILICVILILSSCEKNTQNDTSFLNDDFRKGLWVNGDNKDTLEFVNKSTLLRRGYYSNEEYLYRIENKKMYVSLPGKKYETEHSVKSADGNKVILGNMYITTGLNDNSGTFYKK